jgi:hypothetical protein
MSCATGNSGWKILVVSIMTKTVFLGNVLTNQNSPFQITDKTKT